MLPIIYITLPSFAVFAFIGAFFALLFVYFRIEKFNVKFVDMLKIFAVSAVGAYIGATILFVVTRTPWLIANFSVDNLIRLITRGGIVYYGGLFGVLLAIKMYAKFCRNNERAIFKMITPAIPLFHSFGRIGCLMAGCCFGRSLPAPIIFNGVYIDRIPTQAIESLFNLAIFFTIIFVEKRRNDWDSLRFYLLSYATFRFAIEFLRDDVARGVFLTLSTSQWISIGIIVYYLFKLLRKGRKEDLKGDAI